jgi:hypothetical protein
MMKKRIALLFALVVLLTSLVPQVVLAEDPNYYTSVIMSDITSGAPVVGFTFTTDVSLSVSNVAPGWTGIQGVDLYIEFDPTIVNVEDDDQNAANGTQVKVTTEFFGSSIIVAKNEVVACPGGGTCVHLALSHTSTPILNKTGRVAKITWSSLLAGDAAFGVDTTATVMSNDNGIDIPINSVAIPNITVVDPGFINGVVTRQGVQGTPPDYSMTDINAYNIGGGVVSTVQTLADGTFTMAVPMGGTYLLQASYNGYLKAQRSNTYVVGGTIWLPTVQLLGGDVNADNNINILDIVAIISFYGTAGLPTTDANDINDDGTIDIYDLTIAAGNFGKVGPLNW